MLVTGRPTRWLDEVIETTGHVGVAVGANGAVIYGMEREQILTAHTLAPDVMPDLATRAPRLLSPTRFAVEYGNEFAAEPGDYRPRLGDQPPAGPPRAADPAPGVVGDLATIFAAPA